MALEDALTLVLATAVVGLVMAAGISRVIGRQVVEDARANAIALLIREGSVIFLRREYRALAVFVAIVFGIMVVVTGWKTGLAYLLGAGTSSLAGFTGMFTATRANVRLAMAARDRGVSAALSVGVLSGSVMGLAVASFGLLGLVAVLVLLDPASQSLAVLTAFGLGASSVALFARVGGGIYTKSADVGADIVGKLEVGIPEDDPRNPGVIADNVGDNVGDVAGMGADIFESYVNCIVATLLIAVTVPTPGDDTELLMVLPLLLCSAGFLASLLGLASIRLVRKLPPNVVLMCALVVAEILFLVLAWLIVTRLGFDESLFWVVLSGTAGGLVIGVATDIATTGRAVQRIAEAGQTGAAMVVITGMAVGMRSMTVPLLALGAIIFAATQIAGMYGLALAGVAMLAPVSIVMALDASGPVADNAGGIAEMAKLGKQTRMVTDQLDELGNTTAAIGKGFAVGAAALTALAVISAYVSVVTAHYPGFDLQIADPRVLVGLFIGGLLPFLFSASTMTAVGQSAAEIVAEIRRQFDEIPGLLEGEAEPDNTRCMIIASNAAVRRMTFPVLLAVSMPILIGFTLGPLALGGLLGGALVTGVLLALFMANSGAAWDNAKKYVERGNLGGKGSPVHSACVIGDTIGDPFKDTAGPSLNILVKFMAVTGLFISPFL
jgi:K(+)-stimulated pyrophosphate-energized sodium pump